MGLFKKKEAAPAPQQEATPAPAAEQNVTYTGLSGGNSSSG